MNDIHRRRRNAQNRDYNDNLIPARIGALINGVNTIPVPGMPAWVYITLMKGDQPGAVSTAMCHTVNPRWWLPVLLSILKDGSYYIERTDPNRINMYNSGSTAGILNSDDVGPHTHSDGAMTDPVPNSRLLNGQVQLVSPGSYILNVAPFFYYDITGTKTWWAGGTIDLSSYINVSPGQQQWVEVDMDITNNVLTAVAGPVSPLTIPLGPSDLAAIDTNPNLPLAATIISYGTPIQSQTDILDCSYVKTQAFNASAAGTVTDVTASSPLNSSGGTTPDISLTGIVPVANGGTGSSTLLGAGLPTIVGSVHMTGQNAAIADTPIVTPATDGQYQVSVVLTDTTSGVSGTIDATITWTDYNGTQTATTSSITVSGTGEVDLVKTIYAKTSGAIKYRVDFHTIVGSPAFAIDIKVVRLS